MFKEIFKFEIRYQLRQPIFYICLAIFFLLTFGAVTTDSVRIGGSIGNVNRNGSFVIMQIMLIMSAIGVFTTTAFVANAIHRDFEYNTQSLFFSKPITKRDYLGGRFLGTFLVSVAVFVGVALAIVIGSMMPWLEAERIGPFAAGPYIFAMLALVVPNIFLSGAIFFSLATLTRNMLYTYAGVAAFFVGYAIAQSFLQDLDNRFLASLLDPFGFAAFFLGTKYWTVFERNNALLPLDGALLWNRLLWTGLGAAVLAFTFRRFKFIAVAEAGGSKRRKNEEAPENAPIWHGAHFHVTRDFSWHATLRQFLYQTKIELNGIVRGVPFIVLMFLGVLNIVGNSQAVDQMFDTPVFPVTHLMLQVIQSGYLVFLLIIVTNYSGELVWRERSLKLNEVYDALPVKTWVFWASKLFALMLTVLLLLAAAGLTAIAVQSFRGFHDYQILLYLQGLFLEIAPSFLMMVALALFGQAIINNKYAGFLFMVLYFVSLFALPAMNLEHHLYLFGTAPDAPYSDMNGYGHYVKPLFWFTVYWSIFSLILIVLSHLFWVRGTESNFALRGKIARRRLTPAVAGVLLVASAGLASTGGYIFYNTNVLNHYRTQEENEKRLADFEKTYKRYEGMPQPRIAAVRAGVDIYPEERRVTIRGEYTLRNKTQQPIRDLHLALNPDVRIVSIAMPARLKMSDPNRGYYIYELIPPLAAGAEMPLKFDLAVENRGFENGRGNTNVVYNGTFFNNYDYFPTLGYSRQSELQDRNKRRKYGLAPVQRYPDVADAKGRQNNYISSQADWIDFDTTVSTSADQIALAPGYLQKEWTANGRRYFHYRMDSPILGFWSYLSARYEVKRDRWNGVNIEVYYDKAHPYNVDRMIYSVKKSLDYFTKNFGPYQHKQVRIVEFPRYARFAQSFPNTIPFSESIGFIANLKDPDSIDYVFYVTAHEVAHQWWAHQVIGGAVQGATVMSETMSQYSALMVMEKEYGKDKMRRFLKYELDSYLRGRGGELVQEMPLIRVEDQGYIHYRKGSLVMYALRDYVGEEALNRALSQYVRDKKFQEPPYTNSLEFLSYVKRAVPPERESILNDLFETITLYENRAVEVKATRRSDGKYVVRVTVDAKKYRADGKGKENQVAIDDWVDIGVLGETAGVKKSKELGPVLAMEKRHITAEKNVFEFVVGQKPAKAGIDPLNKLIDRNPEDNVASVSM